jgi:Ca-activated chloride channel homolog
MLLKYPLVLLLWVPIGALFYWYRNNKSVHTIRFPKAARLVSMSSSGMHKQLKLTQWLDIIIPMVIVFTMAQPQWIESTKHQTKKGIDIMAILDTSGSMNAEDFKPKNRMTVAKETLIQFVKKRSSDRIGLVVFGTDALTKAPITYDHAIIRHHINQTEVGDAGDGTAIGLAVATALNRIDSAKAKSKILILITDGVNNAGQIDPISAAKLAVSKGIKVYAIGIGNKKGAPIPVHHPTYGKRYARHPNGQLILTEFDDTVLKQIARLTNGAYFNATNTDELKSVYKQIDTLEKTVIQTKKEYEVIQLFPYFIALLIGFILLKEGLVLGRLIGVRT